MSAVIGLVVSVLLSGTARPAVPVAGTVVELEGRVTATAPGAKPHALARGEGVRADDRIHTDAGAHVVIRLAKNHAIWSLRENLDRRVDQSVAWAAAPAKADLFPNVPDAAWVTAGRPGGWEAAHSANEVESKESAAAPAPPEVQAAQGSLESSSVPEPPPPFGMNNADAGAGASDDAMGGASTRGLGAGGGGGGGGSGGSGANLPERARAHGNAKPAPSATPPSKSKKALDGAGAGATVAAPQGSLAQKTVKLERKDRLSKNDAGAGPMSFDEEAPPAAAAPKRLRVLDRGALDAGVVERALAPMNEALGCLADGSSFEVTLGIANGTVGEVMLSDQGAADANAFACVSDAAAHAVFPAGTSGVVKLRIGP